MGTAGIHNQGGLLQAQGFLRKHKNPKGSLAGWKGKWEKTRGKRTLENKEHFHLPLPSPLPCLPRDSFQAQQRKTLLQGEKWFIKTRKASCFSFSHAGEPTNRFFPQKEANPYNVLKVQRLNESFWPFTETQETPPKPEEKISFHRGGRALEELPRDIPNPPEKFWGSSISIYYKPHRKNISFSSSSTDSLSSPGLFMF